jgi:3-isopropylmalate dehydrogenase
LMPSASIGVETSLFEPIHGSFPQATGLDIANPLATVLSAAMMFEMAFDLQEEGSTIRNAVQKSLDDGVVTEDLADGGKAYKTSQVGDYLAKLISENTI